MEIIPLKEAKRRARSGGSGPKPPRDSGAASLVLDPRAPLVCAREFLMRRFTVDGRRTLHHHGGAFSAWSGTHYPLVDEAELRADLYDFLDDARRPGQGELPFNPNRANVGDVLDALRAASHLPSAVRAPAWLDGAADLPPSEIISCANGLLHLPSLELLPHSPDFFVPNALPYDFEVNTTVPEGLLRFLEALWPDDAEAITTLQEMAGYFLAGDTSQQKIFLIVGPKRSGKGTIARLLTGMLGADNVAAPTLSSLAANFGLAPLIGRTLAIISDARLGARTDQAAIAERLLSISGEDMATVDRKHIDPWTGRLSARFLILSNELPRIADTSGALASRFIILTLRRSFYGAEDPTLTGRLLSDLPGVLRWSIDGWARLRARGHFLQPASSEEALRHLRDLASAAGAFVRELCIVEPWREVAVTVLFDRWCDWCKTQGRDRHGTTQSFGRDLHTLIPTLEVSQPRDGGDRARVYRGLGLR